MLFGDWPFAPELAVAHHTVEYERSPGLDTAGHPRHDRGNALARLPRLS